MSRLTADANPMKTAPREQMLPDGVGPVGAKFAAAPPLLSAGSRGEYYFARRVVRETEWAPEVLVPGAAESESEPERHERANAAEDLPGDFPAKVGCEPRGEPERLTVPVFSPSVAVYYADGVPVLQA
jgi:hypothetical protein